MSQQKVKCFTYPDILEILELPIVPAEFDCDEYDSTTLTAGEEREGEKRLYKHVEECDNCAKLLQEVKEDLATEEEP